jgi:S-formylglutathione hydrolase FrmB
MARLRKTRWIAGACAAVAALAVVTVPSGPAEAGPAPRARAAATADDGAKVVEEVRVDARTLDIRINTPAIGTDQWVRLLLPAGWDEQPSRTWPAAYLLHGSGEIADYKSWTTYTDVEQWAANKDVLFVLPSDGAAGMYSAWWNWGGPAKPDWETFHTAEVLQIVERGYGAATRRVVAGLSIGGYGAMAYAFRHQGMFKAAASYSGVLNTTMYAIPNFIQMIVMREGLNFYALWGNEYMQRNIWIAHNPFDNAEKLRGVGLYVSSGNGQAGPLDVAAGVDIIEPLAILSSKSFTDRLTQLKIPVTTNYYGNGTHTWPYWQRELKASWPVLAAGLGVPAN